MSQATQDDRPVVIRASNLGKAYTSFASPLQRLRSVLFGLDLSQGSFWALRDFNLEVRKGDVLGVVGQNGAGKSTLLQILCSTLKPTTGTLSVDGRIAALLELGAGFNPDFTGRDNLLLNGPLLGLTREQLSDRLQSIIDFSGIGAFIDQPVKTYSSGMFVRLAFSLATSVDPDILVVDEALAVGDGEFARKSFDRILQMRDRGTTILFCSHALYQVEAFCSHVVWLDHGVVRAMGNPSSVIREYSLFLAGQASADSAPLPVPATMPNGDPLLSGSAESAASVTASAPVASAPAPVWTPPPDSPTLTPGHASITRVEASMDGVPGNQLTCKSGSGILRVVMDFESDPTLPPPSAGMTFEIGTLMTLSSVVSKSDGVVLERDANGRGRATIRFDGVPLRKGEYVLNAYMATADALHFYSAIQGFATLTVVDKRPEPGAIDLPHVWELEAGSGPHALSLRT
ncbi:MAG: ABC transporter ATP-binding protein [Ramlibacter sp.]|nr:ABC transporter ATP-binding protein [Ramlibacter sp.]